jgi:hypothetical protein
MTNADGTALIGYSANVLTSTFRVEAMGLEPTNLLTASSWQAHRCMSRSVADPDFVSLRVAARRPLSSR